MGVNGLWEAINPTCVKHVPLRWNTMHGKRLAVDLTHWIVESSSTKSDFKNLYLRNLFFRIQHLVSLGVKLIFVLDGKPWHFKKYAYFKRYNLGSVKDMNITRKYNYIRDKCKLLLDTLSIPCVQLSSGDAEAFCAQLNALGVVDGVMSPDSDGMNNVIFMCLLLYIIANICTFITVLLFGAKKVYFNYKKRNPVISMVNIEIIKFSIIKPFR